jgi:hypothetical protein
MFKLTHKREGTQLRKDERRLRRPEIRLIEAIYPEVDPRSMHVVCVTIPVQPARGSPSTPRKRRFP